MKETVTKQKNELGAKNEVAAKQKAGSTPSDQDMETSKELKEAVMEQENESEAKAKVAAKTQTRA